ncbi:MAG: hypothetical protein WAM66_01955 [Acidobacteriaceae bacterium]
MTMHAFRRSKVGGRKVGLAQLLFVRRIYAASILDPLIEMPPNYVSLLMPLC